MNQNSNQPSPNVPQRTVPYPNPMFQSQSPLSAGLYSQHSQNNPMINPQFYHMQNIQMHQHLMMQNQMARLQMMGQMNNQYREHLLANAQMAGAHSGMGAHLAAQQMAAHASAQHGMMGAAAARTASHVSESGSARKMNISSNVVTANDNGPNSNNETNQRAGNLQRSESNSMSQNGFSQINKQGSKNDLQNSDNHHQTNNNNNKGKNNNQLPDLNLPKQNNMLHEEWYNPNFGEITEYNVLDYFCHHTNPFYETSSFCFNEMRRKVNKEALATMFGYEYQLTFCQPPIMFIISKIERTGDMMSNENKPKTLASYHIIAGRVRKAPDLGSIITCRLKASIHHLREAFDKITEKSRYHPAIGHWWDHDKIKDKKKELNKEEDMLLRNNFQTENTDFLLRELHHDLVTGAYGNLPGKEEVLKTENTKKETTSTVTTKKETETMNEEDSLPSDAKRRKILQQ